MRYALPVIDGVDLLSGSSPLPDGAITPVSNWDEVIHICWFYLKIVGDHVTEKTQAEKDSYDAANPPTTAELQEQAQLHLDDTDWYVTRLVDPGAGDPVPQEITDSRIEARGIL